MAKVRFIGREPHTVPWLGRTVQPDELVDVPDADFESYACQPDLWQSVQEPRTPAVEDTAAVEIKPARRRGGKEG